MLRALIKSGQLTPGMLRALQAERDEVSEVPIDLDCRGLTVRPSLPQQHDEPEGPFALMEFCERRRSG